MARRISRKMVAVIAAPLALGAVALPMASSANAGLLDSILGVLDITDLGDNVPFTTGGELVKLCLLDGQIVDIAVANAGSGCDDEVAAVQGPKGDKGDKGDPGVAGANGATGAIGATGLRGPAGDDGVSGYKMIKTKFTVSKQSVKSLQVNCGGSLKVTGGGVYSSSNAIVPLANHPASNAKSWKARVANTAGSSKTVYVYAICASV